MAGAVVAFFAMLPLEAAFAALPERCERVSVRGLGVACRKGNGLQVTADAGTDLLVHGHDFAAMGDEPVAVDGPRRPVCAPAGSHRMVVVYARPADATNRYAERLSSIRRLVADANSALNAAAAIDGATADYRVACTDSGEVEVRHEVLPTPSSTDSFNSVVTDLRAKGYTSILEKGWVWYEGSIGSGIAGTGHLYWDESRSVNNRNNAAAGTSSTFGIQWGWVAGYSVRTWMHENGHNLGAVQRNAPDSSGAAHCTDGQDIMCYDDGGAPYDPNVCTDRQHFDCGQDTYFNPDPDPSSYLAKNWNLAWHANRFMDLRPTVTLPTPSPTASEEAGEALITLRRRGIIDVDVRVDWVFVPGTLDATDVGATAGTLDLASGQRSGVVRIPLVADGLPEDAEQATIRFTSAHTGTEIPSATVTVVDSAESGTSPDPAVGPLPDLAIAKFRSGPYAKEDVRNTTGEGQVRGKRARRGTKTAFVVRASNDGDEPEAFWMKVRTYRGFRVVVRDAKTNEWLLATSRSSALKVGLDPGSRRVLTVKILVRRNAPTGLRRAMRMVLTPPGDPIADVTLANVRVR